MSEVKEMGIFGKAVHYHKDNGFAGAKWEVVDEVERDILPNLMQDGE